MGTLALISLDSTRAGVSVEINTTYLSAANEGTVVEATGKVMKAGRTLVSIVQSVTSRSMVQLAVDRSMVQSPYSAVSVWCW